MLKISSKWNHHCCLLRYQLFINQISLTKAYIVAANKLQIISLISVSLTRYKRENALLIGAYFWQNIIAYKCYYKICLNFILTWQNKNHCNTVQFCTPRRCLKFLSWNTSTNFILTWQNKNHMGIKVVWNTIQFWTPLRCLKMDFLFEIQVRSSWFMT